MTENYDFDIPEVSVEAGPHPAIIREAEIRQGPAAPYIRMVLEVTSGPAKGENLFYNITLSRKPFAVRRTKRDLEAVLNTILLNGVDIQQVVRDLLYKPCTAMVIIGEYQGEPRPEVQRLMEAGDGDSILADAEALDAGREESYLEDELPF